MSLCSWLINVRVYELDYRATNNKVLSLKILIHMAFGKVMLYMISKSPLVLETYNINYEK